MPPLPPSLLSSVLQFGGLFIRRHRIKISRVLNVDDEALKLGSGDDTAIVPSAPGEAAAEISQLASALQDLQKEVREMRETLLHVVPLTHEEKASPSRLPPLQR